MNDSSFWQALDELVSLSTIHVDRPANTAHPRFPAIIYPFDYGYLDETTSGDCDGIDVWRGSLSAETVTAIVCTVDLFKRDSEMKLLIGCNSAECKRIHAFHNVNQQHAILNTRPIAKTDASPTIS